MTELVNKDALGDDVLFMNLITNPVFANREDFTKAMTSSDYPKGKCELTITINGVQLVHADFREALIALVMPQASSMAERTIEEQRLKIYEEAAQDVREKIEREMRNSSNDLEYMIERLTEVKNRVDVINQRNDQ